MDTSIWTKTEVASVTQRLLDYWPRSFYTPAGAMREQTIQLWVGRLERYPYDLVYGILEEVKKYEEKDFRSSLERR